MNPWLLVPAFFLLCALGFVWLLLRDGEVADPEPYDPSFAGEPDSVDAVHDGYERSKYFTGEEAATPQAAAQVPAVVAGQDLDDSKLSAELRAAYARYRRGEDIYAGARHEPSPEVKR